MAGKDPGPMTYAGAGVNIDAGNETVDRIGPIARATFRPEVLTGIGGFGALFALDTGRYKNPVLVSSTDGVGTKLKVAFLSGSHDTVGIDLVAMCVNDIVTLGAEPLFFLDYLGTGALRPDVAEAVVRGIARGCTEAGCSLIGGETAEMPSFYREGEYDLAGFAVGVVERDRILDGSAVTEGDVLIGIPSSGLHSNGYSLVRQIVFDRLALPLDEPMEPFGRTLAEELLEPTRIYVKPIRSLLDRVPVHGLAHITGGGLVENIPRILPDGLGAVLTKGSWPVPAIFPFLQEAGAIEEGEMLRTFNNGIGMAVIVPADSANEAMEHLHPLGERAFEIGRVTRRRSGEEPLVLHG